MDLREGDSHLLLLDGRGTEKFWGLSRWCRVICGRDRRGGLNGRGTSPTGLLALAVFQEFFPGLGTSLAGKLMSPRKAETTSVVLDVGDALLSEDSASNLSAVSGGTPPEISLFEWLL